MRAWRATADDSAMSSVHREGTRKRQRQEYHYQQLLTPSPSTGALGPQHLEDATCTHEPDPFDGSGFSSSAYSWTAQPPPGPIQDQVTGGAGVYEAIFGEAMEPYGGSSSALSGDLYATTTQPEAQAGQTLPSVSHEHQSWNNEVPYSAGSSPGGLRTPQIGTESTGAGRTNNVVPVQDKDTPLQQLSRVDYNLITLLSRLDKGRPQVDMDRLVSPLDPSKASTPAVDDILNRTREFVDVLKLLSEHQPSSPSSPGESPQNPPRAKSLCGRSDDEASTDSPSDSVCSTIPSPALIPSVRPMPALDTGSLIAVLSTYIRVLHLHLIIFAHIYDYLKEVSESGDPVLCPVPGLSFCTFPIRKSPPSQPLCRP